MSIYLSSIDAVLPALVMSYTTLHLAVTITALWLFFLSKHHAQLKSWQQQGAVCRLGAAQAMARCADAMGRLSDLNDVSDAFYLEAVSKCVGALRAAEHDAEGTGTKMQVADALAVSIICWLYENMLWQICIGPCTDNLHGPHWEV